MDVSIVCAGGWGASGISSSLSSSLSSSTVGSGAGARGVVLTGTFPFSFLVNERLVAVAVLVGGFGADAAVSPSGVAGSARSSGTDGLVGGVAVEVEGAFFLVRGGCCVACSCGVLFLVG
ncbi:hypothetical protein V6N12_012915 [Hibiscus sabdariffa]|uniref:Uncharacterized protein n=1 Tax=Hibiscus sabdariffa TaxID=183260 RepID=A0ABR2EJI7_9ROSI